MKTDTLLAFRDAHPEAWPDNPKLCHDDKAGWYLDFDINGGSSDYQFILGHIAHALIEAKVRTMLLDTLDGSIIREWATQQGDHLTTRSGGWCKHTRLEALIEAYKAEVANA